MGDTANPVTTTLTPTSHDQPPLSLPARPTREPSSYLSANSGAPTPSLLTPNTRSEAEAALSSNAGLQTDSAAPTSTELHPVDSNASIDSLDGNGGGGAYGVGMEGGRRMSMGVRPPFPTRSSTNYVNALAAAEERVQESLRTSPAGFYHANGAGTAAGTASNGVVAGSDHANGVNGVGGPDSPATGRLGLERQMSWSDQDMKRMMQQKIVEAGQKDRVLYSRTEEPAV